ncbi:RNA-binding transcriptional accessory protein [Corynebacterium uropygiale]|uniref:RNA-binding transcriptional accessory protein n=1 Tax=Corynebacterium uropygiale TaxID=1775911 RepID=A0A9X1QN53_9CORY|nr:Tex family protein [Corynebacterium uropygiale]MCF4006369.1 RNA-binding transcriptional accessory protein [Corynebacterium uropygiale]
MIARTIATELDVDEHHVAAALTLLSEGNTVPFIARYRKEMTGGLDDTQLRHIEERSTYLAELEERKESILDAIGEQDKLTPELEALIRECDSKARLEDLYLPFKKRRKTKADKAREAGIDPLVDVLVAHPERSPEEEARSYITSGYEDTAAVLAGARAILIDRFATDADLVGEVRECMYATGRMRARVVEGKEQEGAKYRDYFDFAEDFRSLPSHRILALLRGEKEGVLSLHLDAGEAEPYEGMIARHAELDTATSEFLAEAVRFGWRTKLEVSSGLDVRSRLRERAEEEAIRVFRDNLKDLLLAAPAGQRATLGLDPGYRNGVKVAVVDPTGKVCDTVIVYPHQPRKQWTEAVHTLATLCATHGVELIAIGNGTASRETDSLAKEVADLIAQAGGARPTPVVVSEAGASVYSASAVAAQEFPDMDVSLRGAVSIARRLQDPLAELVKIEPKAIGVGQYQHDVNQTALARSLDAVVEDAVNAVGVDLNSASASLLSRVAGINPTVASNIVSYRDEHGAFPSRKELGKVPRLGPKTFEQCAGFLRIRGGEEPLDASAVHPESYSVVRAIVAETGLSVPELMGNDAVLARLNPAAFVDEEHGELTVADILAELKKPGRDPRPEFRTAQFHEGIEKVSDVKPGMILEGTVTNVAAFGAFVDIGVHQDGLVHVSAMSRSFVSDPHEVVRSGEVVKVKVIDVDVDRQRIGLSLRLDDEPGGDKKPARRARAKGDHQGKKAASRRRHPSRRRDGGAAPQGSMAEALKKAGFGR